MRVMNEPDQPTPKKPVTAEPPLDPGAPIIDENGNEWWQHVQPHRPSGKSSTPPSTRESPPEPPEKK